jgi:regulator of replication initiation timing
MNTEDLQKQSKEALIERLEVLNAEEEQIMAEIVMIREELLDRLTEENKDGELIGEYSVTRAKRITFKTSVEEARQLGAIKTAVDTDVLRKLYNKGVEVPGAIETYYLSVRKNQK